MRDAWLCVSLLLALSSGCAIDTSGLAYVTRTENESAHVVHITVWGFHLLTSGSDAGLTLGRSEREYVYMREDEPLTRAESPLTCAPLTVARGAALPRRSDSPLLADIRTTGLAFDANATRVGLSLGMRRRTALRVALDAEVVLTIQFDSEASGTRCVSIRRNP